MGGPTHPASHASERNSAGGEPLVRAQRDVVALGIAIAAVIMFVGIGGRVMPQILRSWLGVDRPPDMLLTNALLLNIALLIFGWRRYEELRREVTVRRAAEEKARALAESDPLTGCRNRRGITSAIDEMLRKARENDQEIVLLLIDLDNFKAINDRGGHKAGDAVLVETAMRIERLLPPDGICARMGGDEFACGFTIEAGDRIRADRIAADIVGAIASPVKIGDLTIDVTVSVGLAASRQPGNAAALPDADMLIHWADIAMYHAKKNGRDRHVVVRAADGKRNPLPQRARNRPAPRHRRGRIRALLRTADRHPDRQARRFRDARALEVARVRHRRPRDVHSACGRPGRDRRTVRKPDPQGA